LKNRLDWWIQNTMDLGIVKS